MVVRALLDRRAETPVDDVVLHDVDRSRLDRIAAVLAGLGVERELRLRVTTDLDGALDGADVVFSAIRVGGAQGRVRDERRALELGILGQETVGAGGLSFGLRTLPVMLDVARRIAERAPRAWLLNFTNPAGMITEALTDVLGSRVIGICDSPVGLVRRAGRALGAEPATLTADYVGINHLGWLRGLTDPTGRDRLPELIGDPGALATTEEGRLFGPELIAGLGAIPNEYLYFYYAQRDLVAELRGGSTRGEVVAADQRSFYSGMVPGGGSALQDWTAARLRRERSYLAEARGDDERDAADLTGGGYEHVALDLVAALTGGPPREVIVNCRNGSAVPQLPSDMIVEIPGTVDASGVTPHPVPNPLTLHQLGLIAAVRAAERTLVDAVRRGSRQEAALAFTLHPLVGSPRIAVALVASTIADHPQLESTLR